MRHREDNRNSIEVVRFDNIGRPLDVYENGVLVMKDGKDLRVRRFGFGLDSLLLLVLGGLFFASYAGKEIGFLLGVCIPLAVFAYIGERIWSKHGQFAAFVSVALMVYVFTTEWGSQFMANTIEFFTNLQKVSYGMGLFVVGAMFIWSLRRGK